MASLNEYIKQRNAATKILAKSADKQIAIAYAKSYKTIQAELAVVYAKYEKAGSLTYAEMAKYNRLDALIEEINAEYTKLTGKTFSKVRLLGKDIYEDAYYRTAFGIEQAGQISLGRVLLNPQAIRASVQNPISGLTLNQRLQKNRAEVLIRTREQITQGMIRGESYATISRRLKDVYEGDLKKTRRIVRTESHRNQNEAILDSLDMAQNKGVRTVKVWEAAGDARPSHITMQGQKVKVDESFKFKTGDNAGAEVVAPGLSGIASEDIDCRCTIREEIVGFEPNVRPTGKRLKQMQERGIITYSNWKGEKGI